MFVKEHSTNFTEKKLENLLESKMFRVLFADEHEHIERASNLHQCTSNKDMLFVILNSLTAIMLKFFFSAAQEMLKIIKIFTKRACAFIWNMESGLFL